MRIIWSDPNSSSLFGCSFEPNSNIRAFSGGIIGYELLAVVYYRIASGLFFGRVFRLVGPRADR